MQVEKCSLADGHYFHLERGGLKRTSEITFPAVTADRLALVSAAGMPAFRPIFDAFTSMGFYNVNPKLMRDLQKPQDGRLLKPAGENIASVLGHLERTAPQAKSLIEEYLQKVVPMIHGVDRKPIGPMESLEFRQGVGGARYPWRLLAQNMSDGTLRAVGILTALFQRNGEAHPTLIGIEEPETALHPRAFSALREALKRASEQTQVIVTSLSPELLDDDSLDVDSILAVDTGSGEPRIAPVDEASRSMLQQHLFSAGELLRLNQIAPDQQTLLVQDRRSADLFADAD